VLQGVSDGAHGRRPGRGDAGGGEDRSLKALLAEAARGDLRHAGDQHRWEERDRSSGGDEAAEHEAVVTAVMDVGLEAREAVADVADHGVEPGSVMAGCPCLVFAGSEAHGSAPGEGVVVGVQGKQDVLAQQVLTIDVAVACDGDGLIFDAYDEVDGLRPQVVQGRRGLALDNFNAEIGRGVGKAGERAGQQRQSRCLDERHPQRTAGGVTGLRKLCADGFVGGERFFGVDGKPLAGWRQLDVAADTTQELHAGLAFELRELYRDRRRTVGERLGDGRDCPAPRKLVEQPKTSQFHRSDYRMIQHRESVLVANGFLADDDCMLLFALLISPLVMAVAALVERRLGPSAAGWVAALPVSITVAAIALTLDAGADAASVMTLSAAGHVAAQVAFAVVFAAVLTRHGLLVGATAGTLVYAGSSVVLSDLPHLLAIAVAAPLLALAPQLVVRGRPQIGVPQRWSTTAVTCIAAAGVAEGTVLTSRLAGPDTAGAVAALPTVSTTLTVAVVMRSGSPAGAHVLAGLIRSLPCYLTFCLVAGLAAPSVGLPAVGLALLACTAAGRLTWRAVPVAPRLATSQ
jgi:hypothetical protein